MGHFLIVILYYLEKQGTENEKWRSQNFLPDFIGARWYDIKSKINKCNYLFSRDTVNVPSNRKAW